MSSLTPDASHALLMAIQNEADIVQIYQHMLKQVRNSNTRRMLERLIAEEQQHEQRMRIRLSEDGMEGPDKEEPVPDIESPNRSQLMDIELENCTVAELISLAIENEGINRDFYKTQHDRAEDWEVKAIFNWLVEQEEKHISHLQNEYDKYQNYEEVNFSDQAEEGESAPEE